MRLRRAGIVALAGSMFAGTASLAAPSSRPKPEPIHITGTAYAFDNQEPIAGAKIRVVELPGAKATTAADGSYDLVVPDGATVTPYIEAVGYHGIHLQTLVTTGRDLKRVNFQVPSVDIYHALAALLGVKLDANDNPARCAVVSTFNTVNVRNLSFADFVAYGAHGVAGATATASPSLPKPIYFNSSVIPDKTLTESSVDGGVIWLNVPAGVYRFTAHHPDTRFATFLATCKPGRLVNANPPQGLYELKAGEQQDNRVRASLRSLRLGTRPGGGHLLRVGLRASEYVLPDATLLRNGRPLARRRPSRYAPGSRALSLPLGSAPGGPVKLRLTLLDAAGNEKVVQRALSLP